jgi:hypothetical protein
VLDGGGLAPKRSRQAMEHAVERGGVERPVDGSGFSTSASTVATSRRRKRREE